MRFCKENILEKGKEGVLRWISEVLPITAGMEEMAHFYRNLFQNSRNLLHQIYMEHNDEDNT